MAAGPQAWITPRQTKFCAQYPHATRDTQCVTISRHVANDSGTTTLLVATAALGVTFIKH
jgi:hypothetical protein